MKSGSGHRVDNGGSNDYILFEFDQDVTVDRAFLDYVSGDSDISVWIGDRNGDISMLNSDILSGFTKENNNGGSYDRWADFNADGLTGDTLVISARDDHNHDAFKLKKLDVSVAGETAIGDYVNTVTVSAGDVSDSDVSGYTNPATADSTDDSTDPVDPITGSTYEAEDMHLRNYKVEHVGDFASGGEVIKRTGHNSYGSAKVNFDGVTGDYDIIVGYYDENDGQSHAAVKVDGHVEASWTWDQHLGSNVASESNFVQYAIDDVHLEYGSEIKLFASVNHNEFGRFDYVKVVDSDTITAAEEGTQDELLLV
jgi:hypothetical protein